MTIFVIFKVQHPSRIAVALEQTFPNDHLSVAPGQWLVSASGTAVDVSNRLGISDGKNGSAIVFSMANYFGRASNELWDWVKTKAERPNG